VRAVAIDVDGALADTRPLWREWLADVQRRARVDLPEDAPEELLDERLGNWRALLERYAEEHGPVHLRRSAEAAEALRRLQAAGVVVGAFTESPEPLARVALAQLGAARRISLFEAGPGALARLLERLGADAVVVSTRADLAAIDPPHDLLDVGLLD
jgi:phosphoglycolate phosphatase-like HAD superfamily hydrolase